MNTIVFFLAEANAALFTCFFGEAGSFTVIPGAEIGIPGGEVV